jgi:GNAT superfamily N-acetyltransferase
LTRSGRDDVTDAELAAAVEADLVEHVARLHEPPIGTVHREAGAVWFTTGLPKAHANGVLRANLSGHHPEGEVARLLAPFRERSLPMMWWVFSSIGGPPPAVDRALRRNGLRLDSDRPGMGLDLERFRPPPVPAGGVIERVKDEASFRRWATVVGRAFDDERFAEGPSVRAGLTMGFDEDVPFRHYVYRLEGASVGASTLSTGAGVAGLANISTVPHQRGRGIGVAVAGAALEEARGLGLRVAALSADEAGIRVYEKLGFHAVSRHLTYVWGPPPVV